MKKTRTHGESHGGQQPVPAPPRPSASGRGKRGVPSCMTCGEHYDVKFIDGHPKFYNHGTETIHKCKGGA